MRITTFSTLGGEHYTACTLKGICLAGPVHTRAELMARLIRAAAELKQETTK